jgi:hypothetical protein
MNFKTAEQVESVCYDMKLADYTRGKNRARINNLFNGVKPFENDEENPINVNFLGGTVIAHDARAQFNSAFLKPGKYFSASVDSGPTHKRSIWSAVVTKEMNRIMGRSMVYYETFRSKFAMDVLHGIGPAAWRNKDCWLPNAVGVEDVGIPANTLLTMENLPFFYIYRSYTVPELIKLTRNRDVAKKAGWNLALVDQCVEWVDRETIALMGTNWPEVWSPEKTVERTKGYGVFYASDQVPTIDCFDFYFWNDDDKHEGWNRRIILDSWSAPQSGTGRGESTRMERNDKEGVDRNQFLFNSGNRKYADQLSELVSFQFADLSSVAPFRYHSVRSLGFLLYAVCHLQNRMRCRFNAAVFEALMNYYRVKSMDDVERALKLDMVNQGFIDETIHFVKPDERWQVNANLIELGMVENQRIIDKNSSSWTAQQGQNQPGDRKTKFQVMAEMNQSTALVSAALGQAYHYQEPEYREIFRRFCNKKSQDRDVLSFRAAVLRQGVPESVLNAECWDIEPTRIMGAGNKTLEMAISEQLMQMRNLYDPEPQRDILRDVTLAITDDPARALRLVPEQPLKISDTVHDAQLSMGTLMMGFPVAVKTGQNHKEFIMVLLTELGQIIQQTEQSGGMAPPDKIKGFQMVAQCIEQHLKVLAQDKDEKQFVAQAEKQLAKLMNLVKAFIQRLQEQMKKQQQSQGDGVDPQTKAKMQAQVITAQSKAKISQDSHTQKTAQRQVAFEMEEQRKQRDFDAEQHRKNVEALHEAGRTNLKSMSEGEGE